VSTALPRSTPHAQNVSSRGILDLVHALDRLESVHSYLLVRHGSVIAEGWWEPFAAETPHMMYSLSKSFTSTAVGLAIADGLFALDDRVIDLLPDDAPAEPDRRLAELRVRHLLTMTTGHATESIDQADRAEHDNWARFILEKPLEFEPGTHFTYNSGASYLLSAIVQRATGQRVLDYLTPRLFAPLGIEGPTWETCPRGIDTGGWGLSARTEDIAKFGQLHLQKGAWDGSQLIPADWIAVATGWQVPNGDPAEPSDWSQGYGFQFWQCRNGAYRGDGAFGQFCVVIPEQDAVVVLTAGLSDMQEELDLVWEHLLPAFDAVSEPAVSEPAVSEPAALPHLALPTQPGAAESPIASKVFGREFRSGDDAAMLTAERVAVTVGGIRHDIDFSYGEWRLGTTTPFDNTSERVAASGAWAAEDTFVVRAWFSESPFRTTISLRFDAEDVELTVEQNVSFDPARFVTRLR
jgi:CubicO group peptidase (beta-lactamase class C family)